MPTPLDVLDTLHAAARDERLVEPGANRLELKTSRVLAHAGPSAFRVDVEGRALVFRVAASCLLAPEPGDLALIADDGIQSYILAILERPGAAPATLSASVPSNTLRIAAAQLSFEASEDLAISAPRATIRAAVFTVTADALTHVARVMTQALERWRTSARSVETVADDIATKAARRTSIVEESDVLNAGVLIQTIATASVTSAESAVVAVREDLRLDGERVTVG